MHENRKSMLLICFIFIAITCMTVEASEYIVETNDTPNSATVIDRETKQVLNEIYVEGQDIEEHVVVTNANIYFTAFYNIGPTYSVEWENNASFLYSFSRKTGEITKLLSFDNKYDHYWVDYIYNDILYIKAWCNQGSTAEYTYGIKNKMVKLIVDKVSHVDFYKNYIVMSDGICRGSDYTPHPLYVYNINTKKLKLVTNKAYRYDLNEKMLYVSVCYNYPKNYDTKIIKYNVVSGKKTLIIKKYEGGTIYRFTGEYMYYVDGSNYYRYDYKTKKRKKLSMVAFYNDLVKYID